MVVSNRVALPARESRAGGLAVALPRRWRERGGLWFGWSGKHRSARVRRAARAARRQHPRTSRWTCREQDHDDYYNGFANRTLWPLLHFRIDLVDYSRETYAGYRRVNALFAEQLAPLLRADDMVWVHDYHLIPLAALLREHGVRLPHRLLPARADAVVDLLAALPSHASCSGRCRPTTSSASRPSATSSASRTTCACSAARHGHRRRPAGAPTGAAFRAGAFPISIDTQRHRAAGRRRGGQAGGAAGCADSLAGRALAIGVDRLDYSKGLPERFRGVRALPASAIREHRGKITFLQIAPVSRGEVASTAQLRDELERLAGHINGRHAEPTGRRCATSTATSRRHADRLLPAGADRRW